MQHEKCILSIFLETAGNLKDLRGYDFHANKVDERHIWNVCVLCCVTMLLWAVSVLQYPWCLHGVAWCLCVLIMFC